MADDFDPGIEGLTRFRRIGSGGFATVYVAWEDAFSRWVAVKVLDELDEAAGRRFARERALMGQSSGHPNVITPMRFGFTNAGQPYLVMQFMEGGSLQDAIDRGNLFPWRDAVDLIRPIAEALGDSHDAGILHKDVKPANILLARNGNPGLTDFGIAGVRDSTVTQMAFTFAHSPPETFADGSDVRDERSDLYSLGSTLYTIITGHPPFDRAGDESQLALLNRIANHPVPPTGENPMLDQFLAWALAKDPAQRPQDAQQFIDGLDRVLAGDEASPDAGRFAGTLSATGPAGTSEPTRVAVRSGAGAETAHAAQGGGAGGAVTRDGWADAGANPAGARRRRSDLVGWAVALVALLGVGAAAWFAFGPDPTDDGAVDASTSVLDETAGPTSTPASPTSDPPDSGVGEAADGDGAVQPPEVQRTILLLQSGTAVQTAVMGEVVLPSTSVSEGGFTVENCESQLIGLQGAFGGGELPRLRDEIAEYPSGSPAGYTDPAGSNRGFRERLDAYVDQFEQGYRACIDGGSFTPVGAYVLGGWASIGSFLCVTEVVTTLNLPDGTGEACPVPDELGTCTRLLAPLLDDFFNAFPDLKPDAGAVCQAAATNDEALLAELAAAG
ncbi:MAG: serine/threonine-protein kinase [Actinomycetota bacterium]